MKRTWNEVKSEDREKKQEGKLNKQKKGVALKNEIKEQDTTQSSCKAAE